ncbi:heavy-metal-associated domain-containing protein [Cyanobacterium aponinum UTEX 3222]|uniref:Heavy metal transport/detoxification protein n=3 Tax=Cyanobacterium aponinum TaxID=379064 RepID=K9Z941_CYAAP|nr:heavy-metal-associated domain-containing protein [Cyanobacterium aponinum]RMD72195.1 MAG: copper chaperone [Cyanobacteria bacterium J149]WRL42890.1 heavy-metal-associated domain-containing protein [Cyanobacterium aponinum UTEX 3222]AFZ55125.1 heavy metal transport/detoxification protein [Cyanobacterium aponinum PCC 10605]MBD2394923.1 heavy-metal-associated domain-containing protein [Cyanobacterium aponinum FACHB-4101]MTF39271.1 heavy metal transporter [Cyanobacterium aponinum 0216]
MANITLNVPSIACEVCAKTITKAIQNVDNIAEINVDVKTKMVNVTTQKAEEIIKQAILDAGHDLA